MWIGDAIKVILHGTQKYDEHKKESREPLYTNSLFILHIYFTGRHKKVKVYTCEVCSKQIKTSLYNLRLHMYTHTGEKRKFIFVALNAFIQNNPYSSDLIS